MGLEGIPLRSRISNRTGATLTCQVDAKQKYNHLCKQAIVLSVFYGSGESSKEHIGQAVSTPAHVLEKTGVCIPMMEASKCTCPVKSFTGYPYEHFYGSAL